MRQLFLAPPEAETTTLSAPRERGGVARPCARTPSATAGPPMRAPASAAFWARRCRGAGAHGRAAGRARQQPRRAGASGAHDPRRPGARQGGGGAGGGGADCAGLRSGSARCAPCGRSATRSTRPCRGRATTPTSSAPPPRKRRRRVRLDSAYGNLAAGLAHGALRRVGARRGPAGQRRPPAGASVRKVSAGRAAACRVGAVPAPRRVARRPRGARRRVARHAARRTPWPRRRRGATARDAPAEAECAAHVRAELACAVRAAYPMPEAAAPAAALCVVPLSEIADPRLLLVYSGAADDDEDDSSDEDNSRRGGRSVRSARTSQTSGSGASVASAGSTASGLAEAFVDCLLPV